MRSYSRKRKNNIIIGTLCGVMLLMVVGYAAFASQLNIKGTSGISSNWDIEITNIRGGNPNGGDAYDITEPTYTPTTATFNTGLKTPYSWNDEKGAFYGSSRTYEVEVTNKGTLTGLVTIANLSCGNNDAIICYAYINNEKNYNDNWERENQSDNYKSEDLNEGQQDYSDIAFTLAPGEKHYIYVGVYYEDVTSQPENLSANINLELNYEQAGVDENGIATPPFTGTIYRWSTNKINIGDSVIGIKTTTDYNTLDKDFFLKHNINNDVVESSEVCFIKDGLHCLIGGDNGTAYETNKAMLLSVFGESACYVWNSQINCNDGSLKVTDNGEGWVETKNNSKFCQIKSDGQSMCGTLVN